MNATQETKATKIHAFEKAGLGKAPYRAIGFSEAKFQACHGAPIQCGASCDYCGTGIMNVYHVESSDGKTFKVGCECVTKTGDESLMMGTRAELRAWKREQHNAAWRKERDAKKAQASLAFAVILENNTALVQALKCDHRIIRDIAAKLETFGSISEAQIALVIKIAADEAAKAAEVMVSAPQGKATVSGQIVSTKYQESEYGGAWKMTVKFTSEAGTWLAYGTVPTSILDAVHPECNGNLVEVLRGRTVSFTAAFARGNESHFAFFSRPTKASINQVAMAA